METNTITKNGKPNTWEDRLLTLLEENAKMATHLMVRNWNTLTNDEKVRVDHLLAKTRIAIREGRG
jgi:hypothetical protein